MNIKYTDANAPMATPTIPGMPKSLNILKSMCFLKRMSFERLLKMCSKAVRPNTIFGSKKKVAKGTKKTEEPKPPTVPIISEIKAKM